MALGTLGLALGALSLAILFARFRRSHSRIEAIPGPPSPSWLYGNMLELILAVPYGVHKFQWQKQYGPLYRVKGCFGENRLMISDSTTIRHILSHTEAFVRSPQHQLIIRTAVGHQSMVCAEGDNHRRLRAAMNPAFSAASVRALFPTFKKAAHEMSRRWEDLCDKQYPNDVLDVYPMLHDTSLQAISEGVVGHNFEADKDLAQHYRNIVVMAAHRSKHTLLMDGVLPYIPELVLKILLRIPPPALAKLSEFYNVIGNVSQRILKDKRDALALGIEAEKDLVSILLASGAQSKTLMTDAEIQDQVGTILLAGQDTTANTIAWVLHVLAGNIDLQGTLRDELSNTDPDASIDYDSLPILNAIIKEVLRFYSALPQTERVAARNSTLPLAEPLITSSGELITEIPVKKGQHLVIAISSYHRLMSVWGDDADQFRPARWLEGKTAASVSSIGTYTHLLAFLGGSRTCIGWRLAIAEIQIIISELVLKFTFSLPAQAGVQSAYAISLAPMKGELPTLPLQIKRL